MIGSLPCARAILSEVGIRSMTSESAFFAGENLKGGKWIFAVCPEENSGCVAQR